MQYVVLVPTLTPRANKPSLSDEARFVHEHRLLDRSTLGSKEDTELPSCHPCVCTLVMDQVSQVHAE